MSDSDQSEGFRLGGGGRVYADARRADEERTRRRMAMIDQTLMPRPDFVRDTPPAWADSPEIDDRRPPPDPMPSPQPEPEPEPEVEAEPVRAKETAEQRKQPLTVVRPLHPDPDPDPEPEARDWRELVSTILELAGMTAIAVSLGAMFTPWVGVLFAGICCVVLGVATSRLLNS